MTSRSVKSTGASPSSSATGPAKANAKAGQTRKRSDFAPATGANTTNIGKRRQAAAALSDNQASAEPIAPDADSQPVEPTELAESDSDEAYEFDLVNDIAQAYVADHFFAEESKTAGSSFFQGLWWKIDCIVVPSSANIKRLILQVVHDHPLAGHSVVTKTNNALNSRFYWLHADTEVGDYIRHCPSCQLQIVYPSQPAGCCNHWIRHHLLGTRSLQISSQACRSLVKVKMLNCSAFVRNVEKATVTFA